MTETSKDAFHPGEYLKDELQARGWTQKDLAEMIERPVRLINQIISGKAGITAATAQQFSAAFGTTPEMWMNLQSQYALAQEKVDREPIVERAEFIEKYPFYAEMVKRGWVEKIANIRKRTEAMQKWFDISPVFAAKTKADLYASKNPLIQQAWVVRAGELANRMSVSTAFSSDCKNILLNKLEMMLDHEEKIKDATSILKKFGIRLVFLQALKGSKIDGACFWLDDQNPVVAMTLRLDRIDNFWFVLRHELEHVFNGDGKEWGGICDDPQSLAPDATHLPECEQIANASAAEFCLPQAELDEYIQSYGSRVFNSDNLEMLSRKTKRHKGLIVGQLQYKTKKWTHQRRALVPVRHFALADAEYRGEWDM